MDIDLDDYNKLGQSEERVLKLSLVFTFILAVFGIGAGIATGSSAVLFDGIYCIIDGVFTLLGLALARLIHLDANQSCGALPGFARRFHSGFWHLEPILLALSAMGLLLVDVYAFFGAVSTLWNGGHSVNFSIAVLFCGFSLFLCGIIIFYEFRANKKIKSALIALDMRSWLLSAAMAMALLLGFAFVFFNRGNSSAFQAYVDPVILCFLALVMLPIPFKTLIEAGKDILLITPIELDEKVTGLVQELVEKYRFLTGYHYVSRVGRSLTVEIHLVLPKDYPIHCVSFFDEIRCQISESVGEVGPDRWLTVCFTADERWAI